MTLCYILDNLGVIVLIASGRASVGYCPPMAIAIDLDGTLIAWGEDHHVPGPWLPGALEALKVLIAAGCEPIVHSCRVTWLIGGGLSGVIELLTDAGFSPYLVSVDADGLQIQTDVPESGLLVGIWVGKGKPIADFYIDDRALTFDGDWPSICRSILPD